MEFFTGLSLARPSHHKMVKSAVRSVQFQTLRTNGGMV